MTIPQRYECYNANIEPRSDGRFLFFAEAEKWVREEIAEKDRTISRLGSDLCDRRISLEAALTLCKGKDEEIAPLKEEIALLKNEHDEALRKSALDQKQCDEITSEAARMAEEIAELRAELESHVWKVSPAMAQAQIDTLNEKIKEQDEAVYCPTCGACGEEGCCPPDRCEHLKCFYGEHYAKTYRELEAENETLRTLVDGVTEIVEIWAAESPAQKVWKADWLAKAKGVLK